MEKYITSDKVGEFVQTLHQKGFTYVTVEPHELSVRLSTGEFIFIKIYQKGSYEELVRHVEEAGKKAQDQVEFDKMMTNATTES